MPLAARRPGSEALIPAVAGAIVAAFFSFGGWWEASKIAGEVRNPRRTLPLAFLCGVAQVTFTYILISAAFLAVLPIDRLTSNTAFVAQFGEVLFGAAGAKLLSVCVLMCVFGGMAALTMASPRVTRAMAQTGAFFPAFAKLHPRFGTPANAILLQTCLSLAVLFLGVFDRWLTSSSRTCSFWRLPRPRCFGCPTRSEAGGSPGRRSFSLPFAQSLAC